MGSSDNILKRIKDRNFDNDVARVLENSDRYRINDGPIRIGSNTLTGSMVEYIVEMLTELDDLLKMIESLNKKISKIEEKQNKKTEDSKEEKEDKKGK
jgi:hypothetical protein